MCWAMAWPTAFSLLPHLILLSPLLHAGWTEELFFVPTVIAMPCMSVYCGEVDHSKKWVPFTILLRTVPVLKRPIYLLYTVKSLLGHTGFLDKSFPSRMPKGSFIIWKPLIVKKMILWGRLGHGGPREFVACLAGTWEKLKPWKLP